MKYALLWYVAGLICMIYWEFRVFADSNFARMSFSWRKGTIVKYVLLTSLLGPLAWIVGAVGYGLSVTE